MASLLPVALAITGLLVGPALYAMPHWRSWDRLLDSFTLAAVGGLSLLHLLPEAYEHGGWPALVLAGVGLFLPRLLNRLEGAGPWVLLTGLVAHALIESAAMGSPQGHGSALGMAVILHRIPVGLAVFSLYHEHPHTHGLGWVAIGALIGATLLGFFAGPSLLSLFGEGVEAGLNAAVAGMLLHVIWGHEHGDPSEGRSERGGWIEAVATLLGLLVVFGMVLGGHAHAGETVLGKMSLLFLETAPLVIGGYVSVSLVYTVVAGVGSTSLDRLQSGLRFGFVEVVDRTLPWVFFGLLGVAVLVPHPVSWGDGIPQVLRMGAVLVFGMVATSSLVRLGPRGMVESVTRSRHAH